MAYIKLVRGEPILSIPDGPRVEVCNVAQRTSIARNAMRGAGVINVGYNFSIRMDIQALLRAGGTNITFEVKPQSENTVYKTGLGDLQLQKKLALKRAKYLEFFGLGDQDKSGRTRNKVDTSIDDVILNPKYVDGFADGVSVSTISVSKESAAEMVEATIASRNDLGFERFDLTPGLIPDEERLPTNSDGEINWQELTADEMAQLSDERLRAIANIALPSARAAGASGLTLGRAVYAVPDDIRVFGLNLFCITYGAFGYLNRRGVGLFGDMEQFGQFDHVISRGRQIPIADYYGDDMSVVEDYLALKDDEGVYFVDGSDLVAVNELQACWIVKDKQGIEIDRLSYNFNAATHLNDYMATQILIPNVSVSQYQYTPANEGTPRNGLSISIRNKNTINLAFVVKVTVTGDSLQNLNGLSSVMSDFGDVIRTPASDTFSITLDPQILNLINYAAERDNYDANSGHGPPDSQSIFSIPADSTLDFTQQFSSILQSYIHEIRNNGSTPEEQSRALEYGNILSKAINPDPGFTVRVDINFLNPVRHSLQGGASLFDCDSAVATTASVVKIVNLDSANGANVGENEEALGEADVGVGGGELDGPEGAGAAVTVVVPRCDSLFAHSIESTAGDSGRIVISLSNNSDSSFLRNNFTAMRISRDVAGEGGMRSYCEGNSILIRPHEDRNFWTIDECTGGMVRFEDLIQSNTRYRYDIQLADRAGNFSTYQSFLFSQRIMPSAISVSPSMTTADLAISQGDQVASISFSVEGTLGQGEDNFQVIKDLLEQQGLTQYFEEGGVNENVVKLNGLLCYEVIRTSMLTGEAQCFGIYRGPNFKFVDTPAVCRSRGVTPAISRADYVYEVHAYVAKGEQVFAQAPLLTRETASGNTLRTTSLVLDEFGNQLPDEQQNDLAGRNAFVPGPAGFLPTGIRSYVNVNGINPILESADGFLDSLSVLNNNHDAYFRLACRYATDMSTEDLQRLGFRKYDIYALFSRSNDGDGAVYVTSAPPLTAVAIPILKRDVYESTPIDTLSVRFKVVAINNLGQVMAAVESEDEIIMPHLRGLAQDPVILNPFAGPIIIPTSPGEPVESREVHESSPLPPIPGNFGRGM